MQRVGNTRLKASGYKKKRRYARTAKITSVDCLIFWYFWEETRRGVHV